MGKGRAIYPMQHLDYLRKTQVKGLFCRLQIKDSGIEAADKERSRK